MFNHLHGRKLYRSPRDAVAFGICAGLAQYLRVDVIFVRLLVVALAFFTDVWPTLLVYAVAVFIVPIDPAQDTVASHQEPKEVPGEKAEEKKEEEVDKKNVETTASVERMDADQNM